jgi:hypothetical protein
MTPWQIFHSLWDRDVGSPGYDKSKWVELEKFIPGPRQQWIEQLKESLRKAREEYRAAGGKWLSWDEVNEAVAELRGEEPED